MYKKSDLQKMITTSDYLFLDRDGVINKRIVGGYISKWEDFEFLEGVLDAIAVFSHYFKRIFIVTNQQGVGKKIMSEQDLQNIHHQLKTSIKNKGGQIDAIYYCPMLKDESNNCRKPGLMMAMKAQKEFPEIVFNKSIMIGDTASDMLFGKNAEMKCVLLKNKHTTAKDLQNADTFIENLSEVANLIKSKN